MIRKLWRKLRQGGLRWLLSAITVRIRKKVYSPSIEVSIPPSPLVSLGTPYGGKRFFDLPGLHGGSIVSCGLGEDASFDVEFAARFGGRVIVVDPTPRAIGHFKAIVARCGQPSEVPYTTEGAQPVEAYDLSLVAREQMVLEPFALWMEKTTLKFFAPQNPDHVSFSITNFQNNYSQAESNPHIEVATKTVPELMEEYELTQVPLLKLDIEGAEIAVLNSLLDCGVLPIQICVEFDGLNVPSRRSRDDYRKIDRKLREKGYKCYDFDGQADFLYVLSKELER